MSSLAAWPARPEGPPRYWCFSCYQRGHVVLLFIFWISHVFFLRESTLLFLSFYVQFSYKKDRYAWPNSLVSPSEHQYVWPGSLAGKARGPHMFLFFEELHVFVQCFSQLSVSLKIINQQYLPISFMFGQKINISCLEAWPPRPEVLGYLIYMFLKVLHFLSYFLRGN